MRKITKLAAVNALVLLGLLITPALLYKTYTLVRRSFAPMINTTADMRAYYPTYSDKDVSTKLLNEFSALTTKYHDFIAWRREPVSFTYTNIGGVYNTRKSSKESIDNSTWFFGGSTIWGTGASDNETIPSYFAQRTDQPVLNLGETGWNSRQSLNYLISIIGDGYTPKRVIFYDGVNDVAHQCRSEIKSIPATSREQEIRTKLTLTSREYLSKRINEFLVAPYLSILSRIKILNASDTGSQFDCASNENKAKRVAEHLINNWYSAFLVTSASGGKFYAVLQPTLFSSVSDNSYLPKTEWNLEKQYEAVYPLVLTYARQKCKDDAKFCGSFIDGRGWINTKDPVFIDFCHLSPAGNKIVSDKLVSKVQG